MFIGHATPERGMTHHHVNGGMPGRQARSRAQGSIGVSPVSRNEGCISANGSAAKFALQAFDGSVQNVLQKKSGSW